MFGQTYNVLTIDLDAYFADCVIGGCDAFTMPITGTLPLFAAIQRMVVVGHSSAGWPRAFQAAQTPSDPSCVELAAWS